MRNRKPILDLILDWRCSLSVYLSHSLILSLSHRDITYSILFEAVTTMLVLLSYQLFHKEILRDGLIYQYLMKERW